MAQLKVLMTADTVGGVWTYALELIHALRLWSCDVVLATMGAPLSPSQAQAAARLPNLTVYESTYRLEWMAAPWADVDAAGDWLLEIAAQVQPDIVHLNNYAHGVLPWSVPTLVVGHSCVYSWWAAVKGEAPPADWQRYYQRVQAGLRQVEVVVAPTRAMLNDLQLHYGPLSTGMVIYNGRTPDVFVHSAQAHAKEDFIFAIGRLWDEAKNISALESIAPQVAWPIYVAGNANHPVGGELPLQHVHNLGYLQAPLVAQWLARASIYALPARYEPFGLSALEAALAGCALVLGDIPPLREVWGDTACFVPPQDQDALGQSLRELIARPTYRQELALRARQRAQQYKATTMGAAYWQLYRWLQTAGKRQLLPAAVAVAGECTPIPVARPEL